MNPLGIKQPCIMIAKNEVLFEQYIIALKRDKDTIDIEGEDEIKRNRIFFDFMIRMFDHLNQLYEKEKSILIDTILKYNLRKESVDNQLLYIFYIMKLHHDLKFNLTYIFSHFLIRDGNQQLLIISILSHV